ncbi:type 1 glutamine amidotransferase domain-containing protein [Plasticicumulans sp.]|uniref:type 1 glutamine amidotransferase domain-containing protein n=1 Tax=Plasticicumulans sp. TaxID=2307179 RepID=UPI002B9CA190|nr:type 1 glutamine amidotransferase domain-containing protein [Plasticicumulans sp.]MBS0601055.1 type 1 glutamine amidotransferase domain-containing protein [Pseudomonadota bacterium]HMW30157.1 type 1 glutamine amidotransferase domain-containing protein [Plasticicumulans sp.]HMW42164.1 type 1 glutamine amidotransferase domain-containing protein [Plasticicumulans sp.]HMX54012.1 type 1 glutamine amidotransferase domain-containing protein [Plasticicumulans sp.]HMZ10750.1 type 1 glutamine amidotr
MNKRVLIIVTSTPLIDGTGHPTGTWADDIAIPYYALREARCLVDFASPLGGTAPIDPRSLCEVEGALPPSVVQFVADRELQQQLAGTRRVAEIDPLRFDALFVPGGHGALWDLPGDAGVAQVVSSMLGYGQIVATLCHGAAALLGATGYGGRPLVAGRRVTSITDAEESAVGLTAVLPVSLEQRLRELGAEFVHDELWRAYVTRDHALITGQNPQSAPLIARHLVDALRLAG